MTKSSATKNQNQKNDSRENKEGEQADVKADAEMLKKLGEMRTRIHESFGKVALSMINLPRYRHLSVMELNSVLLNPLMRDRVAIASQKPAENAEMLADVSIGIAIWASVSEEVDQKIREQIQAGVFPIRLKAEDWNSGDINWLLDVIAPNQKLTTAVMGSFTQVVGGVDVRIHPLVTRLVDPEALKKMGATDISGDKNPDNEKQEKDNS